MVFNSETNKPRGYTFIEYEHERDMHGKIMCLVCNKFKMCYFGCGKFYRHFNPVVDLLDMYVLFLLLS